MKSNKIIIDLESIKNIVCEFYKLHPSKLNKRTRKREIIEPRQMYHYFARIYSEHTFQKIGGAFHYATVLHSEVVVKERLSTSTAFHKQVRDIEQMLLNYYYTEVGNNDEFRKLKYDIIQQIIKAPDILTLNTILTNYKEKTDMKDLKDQFEKDLNNESSNDRFDSSYNIGGAMRNVTHFGRYGTALREYDINKFNKLFSERLTALLQVNNMEVIVEPINLN